MLFLLLCCDIVAVYADVCNILIGMRDKKQQKRLGEIKRHKSKEKN